MTRVVENVPTIIVFLVLKRTNVYNVNMAILYGKQTVNNFNV